MPFPKELVFIDIETDALAGPDADTDKIIEVAAARVDLKTRATVDEWGTLVHDGRGRAPKIGAFHAGGFAGVDWSSGLSIVQALDTLGRCFLREGATVAGQNPSFDLRYLRRDWETIEEYGATGGGPWKPWPKLDYHVVDLVSSSFLLAMTGAIPGCSLRHTAPFAGHGPQKHRALDDVRDAIAVFWLLADMMARGASELEHDRHVREQEARR